MRNLYAPVELLEIEAGDHVCLIYQTPEEQKQRTARYLRQAISRQEKAVCLVDSDHADTLMGGLWEAGLDVEALLGSGRLQIRSLETAHGGSATSGELENFRAVLETERQAAREQGYKTIKLMCEMSWLAGEACTPAYVDEYERVVNRFLEDRSISMMCQYKQEQFSAEVQLGLVLMHPYLSMDGRVYENFYCSPQSEHVASPRPAALLESWLGRLRQHHEAQSSQWHASTHDNLTGLFNRSFYDSELKRLESDPTCPIGMVMVMLDHPELQMEGFNPEVSVEYLRRAAQVLRQSVQDCDLVARVDERQFAVLTPGADFHSMEETVQRIRKTLKAHNQEARRVPLNLFLWGATSRAGATV